MTFSSTSSTGKIRGVAVALKWLYGLLKQSGTVPPPEELIKREIETLGIGETGNKKQYFNKSANGHTICRGAEGVEVVSRKCIFIKHSAFRANAWTAFSEGMSMQFYVCGLLDQPVKFCALVLRFQKR